MEDEVNLIVGCTAGRNDKCSEITSVCRRSKHEEEASLNGYLNTDKFTEMIGNLVYNDPLVKEEDNKHNELLENLGLDFEALDEILCSINSMMSRAMKIAYKKGLEDNSLN